MLKIVLKADHECKLEKTTNDSERNNFNAASEQYLELVKV
jgi:hypothetical protein